MTGVTVSRGDRERLLTRFLDFCPSPDELDIPDGYRDSGFALVDAVFSMQARYEGVQRVVGRYADHVGRHPVGLPTDVGTPDEHGVEDLQQVMERTNGEQAAEAIFDNRSRSGSTKRLKAELVIEAAQRLTEVGLRTRTDVAELPIDERYEGQKRAWTGIRGLGYVTFEYFRLLCGMETSKPDIMVIRWLDGTIGRTPSVTEALHLVAGLTDDLRAEWTQKVPARGIDHTIWRQQSGRRDP